MKVKKNRWHYKLATYYRDSDPKSLCTYFWSMVWGITAIPVFWSIVACVAVGVAFIMILPIIQFFIETDSTLAGIGGLIDIIILIVVWVEIRPYRTPQDNPVFEYIKAKKQGICPLMEYD